MGRLEAGEAKGLLWLLLALLALARCRREKARGWREARPARLASSLRGGRGDVFGSVFVQNELKPSIGLSKCLTHD